MAKKTKKSAEAAIDKIAETMVEDVPEELDEATAEELSENHSKEKENDSKKAEKKEKKKPIFGILAGERVITESSDDARELFNQSRFGSLAENGKVELSLLEALYLLERARLIIKTESGKEIPFETYVKKARKVEPNFWIRYCVFKDMRNRGYIIKTALKFGADFRVYDRGVKPGEDHAKWIVYPVHEASVFTWHEFSAKNRVAHSTKKRLLLGVVDDENDVTYYEVRWMRP
ncbi:tRNA-intron lyase [Candidatus Woesearchaeota archaeon]|nr:tRNA-intron lyase [Candidatus Woesearchaeota archaeon]